MKPTERLNELSRKAEQELAFYRTGDSRGVVHISSVERLDILQRALSVYLDEEHERRQQFEAKVLETLSLLTGANLTQSHAIDKLGRAVELLTGQK